jgi:hypothetical protein
LGAGAAPSAVRADADMSTLRTSTPVSPRAWRETTPASRGSQLLPQRPPTPLGAASCSKTAGHDPCIEQPAARHRSARPKREQPAACVGRERRRGAASCLEIGSADRRQSSQLPYVGRRRRRGAASCPEIRPADRQPSSQLPYVGRRRRRGPASCPEIGPADRRPSSQLPRPGLGHRPFSSQLAERPIEATSDEARGSHARTTDRPAGPSRERRDGAV